MWCIINLTLLFLLIPAERSKYSVWFCVTWSRQFIYIFTLYCNKSVWSYISLLASIITRWVAALSLNWKAVWCCSTSSTWWVFYCCEFCFFISQILFVSKVAISYNTKFFSVDSPGIDSGACVRLLHELLHQLQSDRIADRSRSLPLPLLLPRLVRRPPPPPSHAVLRILLQQCAL